MKQLWLAARRVEGSSGARLALSLILLTCRAVPAQEPAKVSIDEVRDHLLGSAGLIHSAVKIDRSERDYVTLQVEVDETGTVESVRATGGPDEFRNKAEEIEFKRKFKPFERGGEPVRVTFEDYVAIVPLERWADHKVPFPDIKNWNSLKIELKRMPGGFGGPSYTITVHGSGAVEFVGKGGGVLITGHHRGTISKQDLRSLYAVFQQANYLSLRNSYSYPVTDNPGYGTSIEFDGQRKSVFDYVGVMDGMPDVVTEVEKAIDQFGGSDKWVKGNAETGPALVAENWNFRSDSEENRALFASVVAGGSSDLIQLFIAKGALAFGLGKDGTGPLINAAERGDLELVKTLLRLPQKLALGVLSCTLGAAAHSGNLMLTQYLIEKGATVNAEPCGVYQKTTALMGAVESGKPDVVAEILKLEPDVNARDGAGKTALSISAQNDRDSAETARILDLLVEAGADVNSRDDQGETPIFHACQSSRTRLVQKLIRAGADVNARNRNGQTVLMSCFADSSTLKLIVSAGADLNARNRWGRTAAQAARDQGAAEKADLLDAAMAAQTQKPK